MRNTSCFMALSMVALVAHAAECSPKNPERFVEFLPAFSESKGFALQRTVLPLPLVNWSQGLDTEGKQLSGPRKTYLSASDYWRWPSLNKYMQDNDLLSHVRNQTKASAIVDIYKDGSEGVVSFHFKATRGCWRLWQYEVRPS
jgi:hypothetical protein